MMIDIEALIAEATAPGNDGIALESYRAQLLEVRDRINRALGETCTCIECGRELVVPQHLRYMETSKGPVCGPCAENRRYCYWCQSLNAPNTKYCPACGHRADLPRESCDCPKCAPSLCTRPGGAGR